MRDGLATRCRRGEQRLERGQHQQRQRQLRTARPSRNRGDVQVLLGHVRLDGLPGERLLRRVVLQHPDEQVPVAARDLRRKRQQQRR